MIRSFMGRRTGSNTDPPLGMVSIYPVKPSVPTVRAPNLRTGSGAVDHPARCPVHTAKPHPVSKVPPSSLSQEKGVIGRWPGSAASRFLPGPGSVQNRIRADQRVTMCWEGNPRPPPEGFPGPVLASY
jgi:hypothetical protein